MNFPLARVILLILFLSESCQHASSGQDLDWLTHHKFRNRYEGLISLRNGRASYRVVDLVGVSNGLSLDKPSELRILYFLPPRATLSEIRVGERLVDKQYTMIPIDPPHDSGRWNLFDHWPVKDVISNSGVRIDNLAPLITAKSGTEQRLIVPAFLFGNTRPSVFDKYVLSIYVDRSVDSLKCIITDEQGAVLKRNGKGICEKEGGPGRIEASSIISFDIPVSNLKRGLLKVSVIGLYRDDPSGSLLDVQAKFFHEPPPIPQQGG